MPDQSNGYQVIRKYGSGSIKAVEYKNAKLLYVVGQGSVRVEIVENLYGVCEVQPVHHCYSKLEGEVGTNNRFDYFEIDELIHCLQQAKTYLRQKSGNGSASAAPGVNHP
jgi:hypothetical protein